jgi:hypothetical protein
VAFPCYPIDVFISYAHQDEDLRDQLIAHLSNLKQQGVIRDWHGRMIPAGARWSKKIDEHLETAQVILLLISADFMASGYCYGIECKRALERYNAKRALVIPVILRPVDLEGSPIAELQALPDNAKAVTLWNHRDAAFVSVANGIRKALKDLVILPPHPTDELPLDTTLPGDSEEKFNVKRPGANDQKSPPAKALSIRSLRNIKIAIIGALVMLGIGYWLFVYKPPNPPSIRITGIPPYDAEGGTNSSTRIAGEVSGVTPDDFAVVIYSLTKKTWYVQPTDAQPRTKIQPDGTWSAEIHGGIKYAALLVSPSFSPPATTPNYLDSTVGVVAATEVDGK